jgi:hypothetical protein
MSLMPGEPLMSADNVRSLSVDNVASPAEAGVPTLADWGITTSSVAAILPTYLQAQWTSRRPAPARASAWSTCGAVCADHNRFVFLAHCCHFHHRSAHACRHQNRPRTARGQTQSHPR